MDMLERIGEGYLVRKANAVPDQLEKLAKNQLGASPTAVPQASLQKSEPAPSRDDKDDEIARLRQELALARAPKSPVPAPSIRTVSPKTLPATLAPPSRKDAEPLAVRVKRSSAKHRQEEVVRREEKASPKSRRKGSMEIRRESDGRIALIGPAKAQRKKQPVEREPVDLPSPPRAPPSISSASVVSSSSTRRRTSVAERSLRHASSEESLPSFHDVQYPKRASEDEYYIVEVTEEH